MRDGGFASIDVVSAIDSAPISQRQLFTFVLCALIALIDGFDTQAIAFVAPAISEQWHLDAAAFGPVFGAGLAGLASGAFVLGPMTDRFGRRPILIACTSIIGVFTLLTVWCESFTQLLVLRFFTGIGLGGAMPGIIALTSEYAPSRARATILTIMITGFPFGAFAGGILAAYLVPAHGWGSVLLVGGCVALALVPLLFFALPESIGFLARRGNAGPELARLLNRILPASLFSGDEQFVLPEAPLPSFPIRNLFARGRAALTILVWVAFFSNLLVMYFLLSWMPTLFKLGGLGIETAIKTTAVSNVGGIVGAIALGRIIDRFGPIRALSLAYIGAGCCLAFIAAIDRSRWQLLAPGVFLVGFFIVGAQIGINALAAEIYPTGMRSTGVGWALGVGRIGSIVGPIAGGGLLSLGWSIALIFWLMVGPMLVAAMAIFSVGLLLAGSMRARHPSELVPPGLAARETAASDWRSYRPRR